MRLPLFLVAAIVLTVFAIIAGAGTTGLFWGTAAIEWFFGAFLALLVHFLAGGTALWGTNGYVTQRRTVVTQQPPQA